MINCTYITINPYDSFKPFVSTDGSFDDELYCICDCSSYKIKKKTRLQHLQSGKHKAFINLPLKEPTIL